MVIVYWCVWGRIFKNVGLVAKWRPAALRCIAGGPTRFPISTSPPCPVAQIMLSSHGMGAVLGRQIPWILGMVLGLSLLACHDDSASCSGGNGVICDIFSSNLEIRQDPARLHFTDWQVIEGACEPPRCRSTDCADLVFVGVFTQLEATNTTSAVSPPDVRCRYRISSAEGESLDVVLVLAGSSPFSFCCDTGLREFIWYSWSVFVNGVDLGTNPLHVLLPTLDGGAASVDAAMP
jgi:hypothetical protein